MKGFSKIIIILCIAAILVWLLSSFRPNSTGVRILFVGDMMFDRTIRTRIAEKGFDYLFSCATSTLKSFDLVIGNLEGPITSSPSISAGTAPGSLGNMTFTFPIETAFYLRKYNIKVVSLANNHIFDLGRSGIEETKGALREAGVDWFGDPLDSERKSFVFEKNGAHVAIVGFNEFSGVDSIKKIVDEITRLRDTENTIIVFAHWGEEYSEPTVFMKKAAHRFIDAGASLVVGAHPHVIQDMEKYKGKEIYYSLGNFIFDQYWNKEVRTGLGLIVEKKGKSILTDTLHFSINRNGTTCPIE